jgi:hypothetical protein
MINNPFIILEIEPTSNQEIITQAYLRLKEKGGSEEYLSKLDAAYQDSLMYATSGGAEDLFTDHELK